MHAGITITFRDGDDHGEVRVNQTLRRGFRLLIVDNTCWDSSISSSLVSAGIAPTWRR
jgi:hypothetical protein